MSKNPLDTEKSDITTVGAIYDDDGFDGFSDCPVVIDIGGRVYELDNGDALLALYLKTSEGKTVVMDLQREAFYDVLKLMLKYSKIFEPDNE